MKKISVIIAVLMIGLSTLAQNLTIDHDLKILALGDSYTIGESVDESQRWPVLFADMLKSMGKDVEKLDIIARTGWTTLNLMAAMDTALDENTNYNLVTLLIGVNDQYQGKDIADYEPNFRKILLKSLDIVEGDYTRVLVLSIPDYAYSPFGKGNEEISQEIDSYNAINLAVTREYNIAYVNITPISREGLSRPELIASDGLHPSGKQYGEWISRIFRDLQIKRPK